MHAAAHPRMKTLTMLALAALGFDLFFEQQLPSGVDPRPIPARVAAEHRGAYEVWSASGSGVAQLAGRLRLAPSEEGLPGVGDWVLLDGSPAPGRTTLIERVLARRTMFTRGAAGREVRTQVVAANVDLVFAVCGLDADFNIRRIERYLARIWASGAAPAVILSKADLCDRYAERRAEVARHCGDVPVIVTSALQGDGLDEVRARIGHGMTVALVGSSGAGKSTLVNALVGETRMVTGAVRESDGRGCHVTTHRQLVLLPGGGVLLDTPGMRELQLVDDSGLDAVFGEIAELATQCRYRDCRHEAEPGCAVRAAVESGELAVERLDHFRKLEQEAQAYERRHDARARKQEAKMWGQLSDEVAQLRRWKGGKN